MKKRKFIKNTTNTQLKVKEKHKSFIFMLKAYKTKILKENISL